MRRQGPLSLQLRHAMSPEAAGQWAGLPFLAPHLVPREVNSWARSCGPVKSLEVANHAEKITTVEIPWQAPLEADAKKTIPIDHATAEAIAQQQQLFREKFGREPEPEDPLFFDPDSAVREFLSAESQNHRKKPGELSCRQQESLGWTPL